MRVAVLGLLISFAVSAQPPVAPTPEAAGNPRGETAGEYNVVNNFELGYRFRAAGGNLEQYRSTINYGNGIRLLGSSLIVTSTNGHGALFDQIALTTQGLGNDPYESASLRIEKNRAYRFDLLWRQNDYFNPGLVSGGGGGQHLMDTQHRMQDYTLTLFPQSRFNLTAGVSTNSETGPAFSSIQQFDDTGGIFPLFSDVQRVWREYRIGGEARLSWINLNLTYGWLDFKDDTGSVLAASGVPGTAVLIPPPGNELARFGSSSPNHGASPYLRAVLFTNHTFFNANGRFTYSSGRGAFVVDESGQGLSSSLSRIQNVVTLGDGGRPAATGNLNLNFTPASQLTISNNSSVYNIRNWGNSFYTQFDTATQTTTALFYNFLGVRTIANDIVVNYDVSRLWGIMAAYHFSDRLINTIGQVQSAGFLSNRLTEQSNQLNSGEAGFRVKPLSGLTALFSAEIGSNSHPFTPIAQASFHVLNGRLQYRKKTVLLTAAANASYNVNATSLTSYGSQSRTFSVSGNWTPRDNLTLDAGFTRLHTYTIGGIAYFLNQQLITGQSSLYLSNINSLYAGVHYTIRRRVDLYAGYTRVQDLGDGRSNALGLVSSPFPVFQAAQTFPLTFQSPVGRVSVLILAKLRWNAGYQYYGYKEDFNTNLNFRANTGYTSLSFSF